MSSKDLEGRTVLDLLSDKMSERAQLLNGQCTSNFLYGIKSMKGEGVHRYSRGGYRKNISE
jgi:hypothetical protein